MTPPPINEASNRQRTALRLVFMGTPDFAVPALAALIDAGHEILRAYSQPPRRAGRGQKERSSPVHTFAERHGIEVRTPTKLGDGPEQKAFAALNADAAVVIAYGLMLPQRILDATTCGGRKRRLSSTLSFGMSSELSPPDV